MPTTAARAGRACKRLAIAVVAGILNLCKWAVATTIKALRRKNAKTLAIVISCLSMLLFVKLHVLCPVEDQDHALQIENVCQKYKKGELMGDLCHDLCDIRNIAYKLSSCQRFSLAKSPIIEGSWRNNSIVLKFVKTPPYKLYKTGPYNKKIYPTKYQFARIMENEITKRYNLTAKVTPEDVEKFWDQSKLKSPVAHMHMDNAWPLIHSNEFMTPVLYGNYDIFPKVLGTCGPLLAVQKLKPLTEYWHFFALYDTVDQWIDRVKVAVKILDYIADLESKPQDSLLICNMKLTDFGLTDDNKRVMYLDVESVHPQSVANRITSNGTHCRRHSECDYKNCRSFCNLITFKCQHGVVNNNLQIVCEKIFLGWVSSKVMVPGLLIGPHTPRVLSEVLELCANPAGETGTPRAGTSHDIGKRLFDLLVQLSYTTK